MKIRLLGKEPFSKSQGVFCSLAVFSVALLVQFAFIHNFLDNKIVSDFLPSAVDAIDYYDRAAEILNGGFSQAFNDTLRMPGYSLFISVFLILFPDNTFLAIRIFQMLAYALSTIYLMQTLRLFFRNSVTLIGTFLYIFFPNWRFTPLILAENLTMLITTIFVFYCCKLLKSNGQIKYILPIAFSAAFATYLKPNNLLLLSFAVLLIFFSKPKNFWRKILITISVSALLLLPWSIFASNSQKQVVPLTLNSGANLYVGTGMRIAYDDGILARSAIELKLDPNANRKYLYDVAKIYTDPKGSNKELTILGLKIWKERLPKQILYGFVKVLFAFGFLSDSSIEYIFGLFMLLVMVTALVNRKHLLHGPLNYAALGYFLILALQAFVFQADRRFITPFALPLGIVVLAQIVSFIELHLRLKKRKDYGL